MRGDLQPTTEIDTYAVTLSIRCCRAVLAISAYYDLESQQFDVSKRPHMLS